MILAKKQTFIIILYFLLSVNTIEISSKSVKRRGIMENINNGIKYAGQMFGIKTASDVANLISKAFSPPSSPIIQKKDSVPPQILTNEQLPTENVFNPTGLVSGLLRLMGFDTGKLGALAINGIIFIAQIIGNTLMGRRRPQPLFEPNNDHTQQQSKSGELDENNEIDYNKGRSVRNGSPLDWILESTSEDLQILLKEMQDKRLPEYLTEIVEKLEKEKGEGDCIKQLLCKSAPFIWSMQQSVLERVNNSTRNNRFENVENHLDVFFKYLPDVDTFKQHGYLCEEKYSNCNTSYSYPNLST